MTTFHSSDYFLAAGTFLMALVCLQEPRKARGRGRAKRGDEVIGIQIEQRLVHSSILPDENHILELQQHIAATMSA